MFENTVILHISDLHFSSQPEKQREKQYIIEDLIETLSKLDEQWKPQIVCISGDIVDKHDVKAYKVAKQQLDNLASKLNISTDHFLFTPGNHDCSRDIMVCPNLENITDDQADKYLNLEIPAYLRNRFEDYQGFCKSFTTPYIWNEKEDYLFGYKSIDNILFWSCNTEWFSYGDHAKLRLGRNIINELHRNSQKSTNNRIIAIMHHGVETDFAESECQYHNDICPPLHHLWRVCDMALYGHSHEQTGGHPNKMENHCYCIRAGATSIGQEYPNNVNLIKINENSFELRYINYVPKNIEQPWITEQNWNTYEWGNGKESDIKGSVEEEGSLAIRSFKSYTEGMEERSDAFLDLTPYFEGRFLSKEYAWGQINSELEEFIMNKTSSGKTYKLELVVSFSVAFLLGRILNPKSGRRVIPMQRTINGLVNWDIEDGLEKKGEMFEFKEEEGEPDGQDVLLLISISSNVYESVTEYCNKQEMKWKRCFHLFLKNPGNDSVCNGYHGWELSKQINRVVEKRTADEKRGTLHIFFAGPNSVMFHLGKLSMSYGKVRIYEYDMEQIGEEIYYPTVSIPMGGTK